MSVPTRDTEPSVADALVLDALVLDAPVPDTAVSRRRLLVGGAVAAVTAGLAAACGKDSGGDGAATRSTSGGDADLAVATLAAGLEVLVVATYGAALDAAIAGKLRAVPPAVAEFAMTAKAHHTEHLAAWNDMLESAGKPKVTAPNATLKPIVDAEFAKVEDIIDVANLALMLEQVAAHTYLKAIPTLTSKPAIQKAAEILVVDQQHQAILLFALGRYPVPESFQTTTKAAVG